MSEEQWRPVYGWEDLYEVSDAGNVRVLEHECVSTAGIRRRFPAKVLKRTRATTGYDQVHLSRGPHRVTAGVHGLVLEAFVGPRPAGMHGCHQDGDRRNNTLANLRWDTPAGNAADMVRHGTHRNSRANHCKNGHEKTPENTYVDYLGRRICHPCNKEWHRKRRAERRAA